jgi:hypothetical protein
MFANAAGFNSDILLPYFMYLLLLFEYREFSRTSEINFQKNIEATIKIFSHAQRMQLLYIRVYAKMLRYSRSDT